MLCGRLSSFTKQVFLRIWLNSLAGTYPLKFNNRNTSARCEICPKLTIKTLERRQWHRSIVNIAIFEPILQLVLHLILHLLLTLKM